MSKSKIHNTTKPSEQRRVPRLALKGNANITVVVRDRNYAGTLVDLSTCGARLKFSEAPESFDAITIHHDGFGSLSGEPIWQTSAEVGMRFYEADRAKFTAPSHACP